MSEPFVDVTGARRRRARARLQRRLKLVGVLVGVLALLGGGLWAVYGSPWLTATAVRVTGVAVLTEEQVTDAAGVPLGGPLATVDTASVAARVRQLPAVARADVARAWPHTVAVAVTERTPTLALALDGTYLWVDAGGAVFHQSADAPPGVILADTRTVDPQILAAMAQVAGLLPPVVRDQADRMRADSVDSVAITLKDGRRIVWGGVDGSDLKSQVILPLLAVKASEYNVSAPTHPTTR